MPAIEQGIQPISHEQAQRIQELTRRNEQLGALSHGEIQHAVRVVTGVYTIDSANPNEFTPPSNILEESRSKAIFQKSADTERKEIWQQWGHSYDEQLEHWKNKFSTTVNQIRTQIPPETDSIQRLALVFGIDAMDLSQQEFTPEKANKFRSRFFGDTGEEKDKDLIHVLKEVVYKNLPDADIIKLIKKDEAWLLKIASNLYGDDAALNRLNKFKYDMTKAHGTPEDKTALEKYRTTGKFVDKIESLNEEQKRALLRLQQAKEDIDIPLETSPTVAPGPENPPPHLPEATAPPPIPNSESVNQLIELEMDRTELQRANELLAPGTEREHFFECFTLPEDKRTPQELAVNIKSKTQGKSDEYRLDYIYQILLGRKLDKIGAKFSGKEADIQNVVEAIMKSPEYENKQILAKNIQHLHQQATTEITIEDNKLRLYMTAVSLFGLRPEEAFWTFIEESGELNPEKVNAIYTALLFREASDEEKKKRNSSEILQTINPIDKYNALYIRNVLAEKLAELLDTDIELSLLEEVGKEVMKDVTKQALLLKQSKTPADRNEIDRFVREKIKYDQAYSTRILQLNQKKGEWNEAFNGKKETVAQAGIRVKPAEANEAGEDLKNSRKEKARVALDFWGQAKIEGKAVLANAEDLKKQKEFTTVQRGNVLFIFQEEPDAEQRADELIAQKQSLDRLSNIQLRKQKPITVLVVPENGNNISCTDIRLGEQVIISGDQKQWPHEATHAGLAQEFGYISALVMLEASALNFSRQVLKEKNSTANISYPVRKFDDQKFKSVYLYGDFLYWILMKELKAYDEEHEAINEENQIKVNKTFLTIFQELGRQNLMSNGHELIKDGVIQQGGTNQQLASLYEDLVGIDIGKVDEHNEYVKWYLEKSKRIKDLDKADALALLKIAGEMPVSQGNTQVN